MSEQQFENPDGGQMDDLEVGSAAPEELCGADCRGQRWRWNLLVEAAEPAAGQAEAALNPGPVKRSTGVDAAPAVLTPAYTALA
jgi:hypothetical protein